MDATYPFATNLARVKYEDLPHNVVECTKKQVLDALGVALAGYAKPGLNELLDIITGWGGSKESTLLYCKRKVPAPNAAQMNASMAHALDYDDVHDAATIHPGVVIIPTCMAVAEKKGDVTGKAFITAVALGVDMMCRLGLATKPETSRAKAGWLLTPLYGFLGAAGAAGRILGLDENGIVNAMGIAYHQCGGNLQTVLDGGLSKRMGPGFAAKGGITAALMAEKGITGAQNSLEGKFGIYQLYHRGGYDPKILTANLGKYFEGINVSTKPYPCCRGVHGSIDAALTLINRHNIRSQDVKKITVFSGEGHYPTLATPLEIKCNPRNIVDAQFSIPWGVATAVAKGRVTMGDYTQAAIESRDVLEVAGKIEVKLDASLNRSDTIEAAKVGITIKNGETFLEQVDDPLGSPQRPMSFDDCAQKFRDCASYSEKELPRKRVLRIIECIGQIERVNDVRELMKLLS